MILISVTVLHWVLSNCEGRIAPSSVRSVPDSSPHRSPPHMQCSMLVGFRQTLDSTDFWGLYIGQQNSAKIIFLESAIDKSHFKLA